MTPPAPLNERAPNRSRRWRSFVLFVLSSVAWGAPVHAQAPSEYASLYTTMQTDLANFTGTVNAGWDGTKPPVEFCGELYPATSVSMPNADFLQTAIIPYLDALQALGVSTIKMSINFPVLYEPYYDSASGANNPAGYQQTLTFYQQVVAAVRQRGLKLIIPTQVVFPYEYTTTTPYLETLSLAQYSAARSTMAQTIATQLQPDYLVVQSEPITEVGNLPSSLGTQLNDPATDLNMVAGILNDLQTAGLRSATLQVSAGMGTWQPNFDTFLTGFVALPMDILCIHVYPINDRIVNGEDQDYLGRILQMADAAHLAGLKVGMDECWLNKEADDELNLSTTDQTIAARNVYSFWAPLDQAFLQTMAEVAYWKDFEFLSPFDSFYYFAYLDYATEQPLIAGMSDADADSYLEQQENMASYAAIAQGATTSTGMYWAQVASGGVSATAPQPPFFGGEPALSDGVYFLTFPDGIDFGYFSYVPFPYLYHFDAGYLYYLAAGDNVGGAYLYDFTSSSWWYTAPSLWPYLYDFTLNAWLYYYPNATDDTHYTTNPRYFFNFATGEIITM
jgi:hypothetical protein